MEIVPVLNCADFSCVKERFALAAGWGAPWIHLDIADGKFAPVTTWNNPDELRVLLEEHPGVSAGVHLMVKDPAAVAEKWLAAGAKRLIVHVESLDGPDGEAIHAIIERCTEHGAEVMLALKPETPVSEVIPYLNLVYAVQCLAVPVGFSGQAFDGRVMEKISYLRLRNPDLTIEVDGGVTPVVAKRVKDAGADIATSGGYIFGSRDPAAAYRELCGV
jgi:ribulose-phosphate 3-epimerase